MCRAGITFESFLQFCRETEDIIGIRENGLSGIRKHQVPTGFLKQCVADGFLQRTQLPADCLRRYVEYIAGFVNRAFARDYPEIP